MLFLQLSSPFPNIQLPCGLIMVANLKTLPSPVISIFKPCLDDGGAWVACNGKESPVIHQESANSPCPTCRRYSLLCVSSVHTKKAIYLICCRKPLFFWFFFVIGTSLESPTESVVRDITVIFQVGVQARSKFCYVKSILQD